MTPSEKQYSKHIGKLFFSKARNSLVLITGITKTIYSNRWQYSIEYVNPNITAAGKTIKCKRIEDLIAAQQWIPAAQYITNQPPVSNEK